MQQTETGQVPDRSFAGAILHMLSVASNTGRCHDNDTGYTGMSALKQVSQAHAPHSSHVLRRHSAPVIGRLPDVCTELQPRGGGLRNCRGARAGASVY